MKKLFMLLIVFVLFTNTAFANNDFTLLPTQTGIVQELDYVDINLNEFAQTKQVIKVKLSTGENKGEIIELENHLTGNPNYDIPVKTGSKVVLHAETDGQEIVYSISDIERFPVLVFLSLLFCGLLIIVGRKKGLYSLVSIILTCILICKLLSPMILFGINPIIATVIICLLSTAITMYLVGGFNRKSTSATLGCTLSLIIAGFLSLLATKLANLTGFNSETSIFLYSAHPELNFVAIAVSTMILATLGAVMDVAMSIASTINEIYTVDNTKTVKELFLCGMNVGRDIIGTMANTLILVYLGSSLPLLLLASNIDLQKFINLNQVVTEISSALIGSCAIILCVPITALISSELIKNMPVKIDFDSIKD